MRLKHEIRDADVAELFIELPDPVRIVIAGGKLHALPAPSFILDVALRNGRFSCSPFIAENNAENGDQRFLRQRIFDIRQIRAVDGAVRVLGVDVAEIPELTGMPVDHRPKPAVVSVVSQSSRIDLRLRTVCDREIEAVVLDRDLRQNIVLYLISDRRSLIRDLLHDVLMLVQRIHDPLLQGLIRFLRKRIGQRKRHSVDFSGEHKRRTRPDRIIVLRKICLATIVIIRIDEAVDLIRVLRGTAVDRHDQFRNRAGCIALCQIEEFRRNPLASDISEFGKLHLAVRHLTHNVFFGLHDVVEQDQMIRLPAFVSFNIKRLCDRMDCFVQDGVRLFLERLVPQDGCCDGNRGEKQDRGCDEREDQAFRHANACFLASR